MFHTNPTVVVVLESDAFEIRKVYVDSASITEQKEVIKIFLCCDGLICSRELDESLPNLHFLEYKNLFVQRHPNGEPKYDEEGLLP